MSSNINKGSGILYSVSNEIKLAYDVASLDLVGVYEFRKLELSGRKL